LADFGKGFTHPSVFLADPSRTRPKVFGGKVSRCLKKFGGPIRAPISFWLAGFWWSFWREVWVKVWQPQKVWREVLAGILAGSFTQPQKVLAGSLAASKKRNQICFMSSLVITWQICPRVHDSK